MPKQWSQFLIEKQELFQKNNYVWIKGDEVSAILKHVFGAKEQDLLDFQNACDNLNHDPTMECRKHASYRLCLNFNDGIAQRLVRQPLIMYANDGVGK